MKIFCIAFAAAFMFIAPAFAENAVSLPGNFSVTLPSQFKTDAEPLSFSISEKNIHLNIITEKLDEDVDLNSAEVRDFLIETIVSEMKKEIPSYNLDSQKEYSVGNYKGLSLKGIMSADDFNTKINIKQYIIFADGTMYNINIACPQSVYGEYSDVFDKIAESFKKK